MAAIGSGTTITFGTSGYSTAVLSVDGPNFVRDAVETTNMGSSGSVMGATVPYREYIPGLFDAGQITVEIQHDPATTPPITKVAETITITFPDASTVACSGFVTEFSVTDPIDDQMTASMTIQWTGVPTLT